MAATKKTVSDIADVAFNYADYMPEGATVDNLVTVGGLTPLYAPEDAYEDNFPPVAGWIDRIQALPEVRSGTKDAYVPYMLRICLEKPTKAVRGTGETKEIVSLKAGDDVLVPITGQLRVNHELLHAVQDDTRVTFGIFRVKGAKKVNEMPSAMWDFHVQLLHQDGISPKKRTGRFAIPLTVDVEPMKMGTTATGAQFDKATGELAESKSA